MKILIKRTSMQNLYFYICSFVMRIFVNLWGLKNEKTDLGDMLE